VGEYIEKFILRTCGEEEEVTDEEHSKLAREEEGKVQELHRGEPKTLETMQNIEVSIVILPVD
jgi:hypothetical protein